MDPKENQIEQESRKQGKSAVSFAGFVLLVLICLAVLSRVTWPKKAGDPLTSRDEIDQLILGQEKDSIDVMILGDSEAIANLSPLTMWEEEGITALNLGSVAQHMYRGREYLELALTVQSPKLVLLEADCLYLTELFKPENYVISRVGSFLPVFRNHDIWKEWVLGEEAVKRDEIERKKVELRLKYMGYHYSGDIAPAKGTEERKATGNGEPVPYWNRVGAKDLLRICRKEGMELIIVSTPTLTNWNQERHEGVEALAKELGVPYVDMTRYGEDFPIQWGRDSRDKGDHLNHSGAVKVSAWLASYLKEAYDLPDHREDTGYDAWREADKSYSLLE